jgi:hypothetical protein
MRKLTVLLPLVFLAAACEQEYECESYCSGNSDETSGTDYLYAVSYDDAEEQCEEMYSCLDEYGNDTYSLVCLCSKT